MIKITLFILLISSAVFSQVFSEVMINQTQQKANKIGTKIIFDKDKEKGIVVWIDSREGVPNVYAQLINSNGQKLGNNHNLSSYKNNIHEFINSYEKGFYEAVFFNDTITLFWFEEEDIKNHTEIRYSIFTQSGVVKENELLYDLGNISYISNLSLLSINNRNLIVFDVWDDFYDINKLYYLFFDNNFNIIKFFSKDLLNNQETLSNISSDNFFLFLNNYNNNYLQLYKIDESGEINDSILYKYNWNQNINKLELKADTLSIILNNNNHNNPNERRHKFDCIRYDIINNLQVDSIYLFSYSEEQGNYLGETRIDEISDRIYTFTYSCWDEYNELHKVIIKSLDNYNQRDSVSFVLDSDDHYVLPECLFLDKDFVYINNLLDHASDVNLIFFDFKSSLHKQEILINTDNYGSSIKNDAQLFLIDNQIIVIYSDSYNNNLIRLFNLKKFPLSNEIEYDDLKSKIYYYRNLYKNGNHYDLIGPQWLQGAFLGNVLYKLNANLSEIVNCDTIYGNNVYNWENSYISIDDFHNPSINFERFISLNKLVKNTYHSQSYVQIHSYYHSNFAYDYQLNHYDENLLTILWRGSNSNNDYRDNNLFFLAFDSNLDSLSGRIWVNDSTLASRIDYMIFYKKVQFTDNGFEIYYRENYKDSVYIKKQIINNNFEKVGVAELIENYKQDEFILTNSIISNNGNILEYWYDNHVVNAQRFDPEYNKIGEPFILRNINNSFYYNLQDIKLQDDMIYMIWEHNNSSGQGTNIYLSAMDFNTLTNIEITELVKPIDYWLSNNYPNPFNPSTKISFTIPSPNIVTIKLFDTIGREVKTILNSFKTAGIHEVELNGSALASGVYFYKITSGDYSETKKMVLLK